MKVAGAAPLEFLGRVRSCLYSFLGFGVKGFREFRGRPACASVYVLVI